MADIAKMDTSALDRPDVSMRLFYPRKERSFFFSKTTGEDMLIPVEGEIVVGARFHVVDRTAPDILFFHGNGEIVADYNDLAPRYNRMGINFLPVDYRGYGRSTGEPTVGAMLRDAHTIFRFLENWRKEKGHSGPLIVMGRSLGSASALELAATIPSEIDGLIIESGFAYAGPLLQLLGISPAALGFKEEEGFANLDKIRKFEGPTLIIHAERDHIIPFSDGQALYDASPAKDKTLIQIPIANHNNLFDIGLREYMAGVKAFVERVKAAASGAPER